MVNLPCGHVIHARCVLSNLESGGEQALGCRVTGSGAQHPRRENLEAAVQADAGLRYRANRMVGGLSPTLGDGRNFFLWHQDSPGIGPALDAISVDDLSHRFEMVKKVLPSLAADHAKLNTHVLQLLNEQLAEGAGSPSQPQTPFSTLRALKLWYLLPGLLHSFDGRVTHKERYKELKKGDVSTLLP